MDNRPRWAATASGAALAPGITVALPTCAANGQVGPCVTRLNNAVNNQITAAYVIKNESENRSWLFSGALEKRMTHGLGFKGGFSYGVSRSMVEPSSTAAAPGVGESNHRRSEQSRASLGQLAGKRIFLQANYTVQLSSWARPRYRCLRRTRTATPAAYFQGRQRRTVSGDLIYIPRDTSE